MIEGKVWGTTEPLLVTPLVEVHRIKANPGFRCSWHIHERKHNAFYVVSGSLRIEVEREQGIDCTEIGGGDLCTVPPGIKHRFVCPPEAALTEALEVYYLEPLGPDIRRFDVGGQFTQQE